MWHCTALKEAGSGPRRTAKTGPSAFYSLHQYLLLPPAAPPVVCGLGAANRSNRKQLESTAAARTPGLTVLVQQVLRGEADTRLTAVSAHTDGRLTQDGTHTQKKLSSPTDPQSTNTCGIQTKPRTDELDRC